MDTSISLNVDQTISKLNLVTQSFVKLNSAATSAISQIGEKFSKLKINVDTSPLSKAIDLGKRFKDGFDLSQFAIGIAKATTSLAANTLAYGFNTAAKGSNTLASIAETATNIKIITSLLTTAVGLGAITVAEKTCSAVQKAGEAINIAFGLSEFSVLGPILLIVAAIAALIAIFTVLFLKCKPFHDFVVSAVNFLKTAAIAAFNNIKETVTSVFGTILTHITNSIANLKKIFNGIIEFFTGVFTGNWKKAFQGLRDIISGIFGQIVNVVKTPINLIIGAINGLIKNINGAISLAAKIPGIGSALKGISIPTIPKLATGGVITSPTLTLVGEAGAEAVMPLQNNTGWISTLAGEIVNRGGMNTSGGSDTNLSLTVKFGESTIATKMISAINRQQRATGKTLITI